MSVLPVVAAETPAAEARAPYVLLTSDGHRIDVMEKPVAQGDRIRIHLWPAGELAIYPARQIDWPATERFNVPRPTPKPAAPPEPGATPFTSTISGASVTKAGGVLELKLIGGGHTQATTSTDGSGAPPPGEGAAAPARPADPNAAAGVLAALTREFADLKSTRDAAVASKAALEAQIADLEAKAVNAAPAGVNYSESPTQKAIAQARESLQAGVDQIALIDKRMSAVRARAIELGGSVD